MSDNNATLYAKNANMSNEIAFLCKNSLTENEYEMSWKATLKKYNAEENKHFQTLWDLCSFWAPAYFKDSFYPFSSTTSRSESTNSMWKKYVSYKDTIANFVEAYVTI